MGGDAAKANGIWLKTWRQALVRAQQTGGCVLCLELLGAGPSPMQEAEMDMARDKGVPVVVVTFGARSTEVDVRAQIEEEGRLRAGLTPGIHSPTADLALQEENSRLQEKIRVLEEKVNEMRTRGLKRMRHVDRELTQPSGPCHEMPDSCGD